MPRLSANSCLKVSVYVRFFDISAEDAHLCNVVLDDLLVGHIALVTDEELVDALGSVAIDLLQPLLDVVE